MCGISGICLLQGHNFELEEADILFSKLLAYSTRRGGDSTGAAIIKTNGALVFKHHVTGREFVESNYYNEMMKKGLKFQSNTDKTMIILGHNRAQTKGTYLNRHNNHPIIANRVIGIHNGWISNDDDLFNANRDNFHRKAQVDSEIIFRLIDYYVKGPNDNTLEAIRWATGLMTGSYACAAVNLRNPWMLWLFRATNPTVVFHYPKRGITAFSSEEDILDRAADGMDLGAAMKIPYGRDEGLGINVLQNCKTKFKLSRGKFASRNNYNDEIDEEINGCKQLCAL